MNWYAYVGNDQINLIYSTGLCGKFKDEGTGCSFVQSFGQWSKGWTDTESKVTAKAVKGAAEKTVNDTVDSINSLERKDVYDVANYISLALTAASLSPCSIYCTSLDAYGVSD
jgi:hypothetical protein